MTVIAADIGGSSTKVAELDGLTVLRARRLPHRDGEADLDALEALLRSWQDGPTASGPVTAAGLALPGVVDRSGRMRSVHDKVGSLVDRDLAGEVGGWLGVPVAVDNDARAAGWGEYVAGAGRGAEVLLTLTLGTGVGSSVVVGGVPLRDGPGHRGVLGGHQQLLPGGPRCTCGRAGCLEALASGWALPRVVAEQRVRHSGSTLAADADLAAVLAAAEAGDPLGVAVRDELVGWWAVGIANASAVLGPDRVVLTGGLAAGAPRFLEPLRRRVGELVWEPAAAPEIRVAPDVWASATTGMADQARRLSRKD